MQHEAEAAAQCEDEQDSGTTRGGGTGGREVVALQKAAQRLTTNQNTIRDSSTMRGRGGSRDEKAADLL